MLNLLLLFLFISHGETTPVGTPLQGIKGGSVTLHCGYQAEDISDIRFIRYKNTTHFSDIPACVNEEYKHESGRVCKTGACGIILKDLNFSDPGKYLLRLYYNSSSEELKFHLHVHDEISVQEGEDLKLDVLLINADKVERNSSGEWKKVWTRGDMKMNDRVIVRERNLTISNFTVTDTGTYRVLDSNNKTLITVTVTESGPESGRESKRTEDHKPKPLPIVLYVFGALALALALVARLVLAEIIFAVYKTYQGQDRNTNHGNYQRVPTQDTVQ